MKSYARLSIFCGLFALLIIPTVVEAQLYVRLSDPVYPFLDRMATRGIISEIPNNTLPLQRDVVAEYLLKIQSDQNRLSTSEQRILKEFLADYRYELANEKYYNLRDVEKSTWFIFHSKDQFRQSLSDIFRYTPEQEAPHIFVWETDNETLWIDWDEMVRYETKNGTGRFLWQDGLRISSQIGDHFSVYMDNYRYQQQIKTGFDTPAQEYKGGYLTQDSGWETSVFNIFDRYQGFDYPHAYLQYSGIAGNFQLSIQPVYWGNGPNSMILSNNVQAFAYVGWNRTFGKSQFSFIHGALQGENINQDEDGRTNFTGQKYLVGHRWDFRMFDRFQFAFTELLVYGNRNMELSYLVPPVLLWASQHNLQQNDNLMFSLEFEYFPVDRLKFAGTFFLDELKIAELSKKWWGNKFGTQLGMHFTPTIGGLPADFTVQFTAVRPWTYTHELQVNTYTHNGRSLGFPDGPNSQLWFAQNRWWLSPRSTISVEYRQLKKGTPPLQEGNPGYYPVGADPDENYGDRDPEFDYATPSLFGEVVTSENYSVLWNYQLTSVFHLRLGYQLSRQQEKTDNYFSLQLRFDY